MGASEKDPTTAPGEDVRRLSDEQRRELEEISKRLDELWHLSGASSPAVPSPEDLSCCGSWSTEAAEEPEASRPCEPDPRADDCPAYMEVRDLRGSINNLVSTTTQHEDRLDDLAGRVMTLDGRVTAEEAAGQMAGAVSELTGRCDALEDAAVEDRKYLREWRVVCDEADRLSKHNQDRRLGELGNDVTSLDDRLRSCDAQQIGYYRRTAHRLEALESAKPATFEELTDVLVRLEALETRLENVPTHPASAPPMCRELAELGRRVERLEGAGSEDRPDYVITEFWLGDEPASAGSAADQKLYDDGYLIDVRPPRADAAQRRILRLTRSVERMEPGAERGFGGGWRVSHRGEALGLRRCWKLNGPGGYSAIHFEAADAVLAWLNRRER